MADYKDAYDFLRRNDPQEEERVEVAALNNFKYTNVFNERKVYCNICFCLLGEQTVTAMTGHRERCGGVDG